MRSRLTQDVVKRHLYYCPITGQFTWRTSTSNRVHVGDVAGSLGHGGYITIVLLGVHIRAHRLAFIYMTGKCPKIVDHIDGQPSNNAWTNLRSASAAQNTQNVKLSARNKSGHRNVSWDAIRQKWLVMVCAHGKRHFGGFHIDLAKAAEEAHSLRKALHKEFAQHA